MIYIIIWVYFFFQKAKIELEDIRKVRSNQGEVIVSSALSNFQEHELTSEDVGSIIQEEDKGNLKDGF